MLRGKATAEKKDDALEVAREWQDQPDTVWADGSRLESEAVGAAVAFRCREGWVKRGIYLGKNKEVFDAEAFAIMRAARLLAERGERGRSYTVFSDSRAAISRHVRPSPGPGKDGHSDGRQPGEPGQHPNHTADTGA